MNIENLLKLQEEDRQLRTLLQERKEVLPARRAAAKKRLHEAQMAVELATKENLDAIKNYERLQSDYTYSRNQMNRAERNAASMTHIRGLEAASAEYATAKQNADTAMAAAEAADIARTPTERRLDAARAFEATEDLAVQQILQELDTRKETVEAEIAEVQARYNEIAATLPPALLKRYERVKMTCWPCAVALNRSTAVCSGCDMVQPMATKQALLAAEKSQSDTIVCCPSCGRILY